MFENALEYCVGEDNNFVYSDQGTAQDICIDEYMNDRWAIKKYLDFYFFYGKK